jgi:PAS domain S-box-containing protein
MSTQVLVALISAGGAAVVALIGVSIKFRGHRARVNAAIDKRYDGLITALSKRLRAVELSHEKCEEQLAAMKQELRLLGGKTGLRQLTAMIVASSAGIIEDCNAPCTRLFQRRRDQLIGERIDALVPPGLLERHRRGFAAFSSRGSFSSQFRRLSTRALRSDGAEIPVEIDLSDSYQEPGGEWVLVAELRSLRESFHDDVSS